MRKSKAETLLRSALVRVGDAFDSCLTDKERVIVLDAANGVRRSICELTGKRYQPITHLTDKKGWEV